MAHRIEVASKIHDTRAQVRKKEINSLGFSGKVDDVKLVDVYTIDAELTREDLDRTASMLANPVFQKAEIDNSIGVNFKYAIEIGYLPGVTDNVGNTTRESIEDLLRQKLPGQAVHTSQLMLLSGDISQDE